MTDEGIELMENDLAPVYTVPAEGDLARGVTRQTVMEITNFYQSRVEHFRRMTMGCVDCRFRAGTHCKHFRESPPAEYLGLDCDAWQWDGVPF